MAALRKEAEAARRRSQRLVEIGKRMPNLDILGSVGYMTQAAALYPDITVEEMDTTVHEFYEKMANLEPVPGGRIKADARVLRAGRNFVVTECEIYNEDGSLAAKALLTFGATAGHALHK